MPSLFYCKPRQFDNFSWYFNTCEFHATDETNATDETTELFIKECPGYSDISSISNGILLQLQSMLENDSTTPLAFTNQRKVLCIKENNKILYTFF